MDEDRTIKKVFNAQPIGRQRKGRTNLRWIDGPEKDLLALRTKNWRTLAERWLFEKAKSHPGLERERSIWSRQHRVGVIDGVWCRQLRVLVAALWDKKLAFRTRERRKILDFYGRTATQGEKEIFGSRAASKFSFGERERPAHKRSN
ncbi:hypothetical protein TNCV_4585061 [Trichonephila clavipes]|nr:hypothetical protein TNCV_4585061 [Trichonephila clavipes]